MQTAIITGGNGGLGYHCARAIAAASPQWHVIIASRDHAKSTEAVRSIIRSVLPHSQRERIEVKVPIQRTFFARD
jgi:NAD(P)-dependent dehydrogenase (short-subunit alcohol dehydrogenase family)